MSRVESDGHRGSDTRDRSTGQAGLGVGRSSIDDIDAAAPHLACERSSSCAEAGLDGGVGDHPGDRLLGDDASDVHHEPPIEVGECLSDDSKWTDQVDRNDLVERFIGHLGEGPETDDTGGVDNSIEAAHAVDGGAHDMAGMVGLVEVDERRRCFRADRRRGLLEPLGVAACEHHGGAVLVELPGDQASEDS